MRLRTKIILVAAPVAVATCATTIVAIHIHRRRERRREATSFLNADIRDALRQLCSLKGEDFVPDGLGTSIYQRRLATLTDRQLVGVYLLIKVSEALRARGINLRQLSREDLVRELIALHAAARHHDRHDLIRLLGSFGMETARSVMDDALLLSAASV